MADEQKTINWNSVVTNAISTLVAAVFVGAAFIVWTAAMSVDDKINTATDDIKNNQVELTNNQRDLQASKETMTNEIASLQIENRILRSRLDSLDEVVRDNSIINSIPADKPLILPKYEVSEPELSEMKQDNIQRIFDEYQKNRIDIQQQMIP